MTSFVIYTGPTAGYKAPFSAFRFPFATVDPHDIEKYIDRWLTSFGTNATVTFVTNEQISILYIQKLIRSRRLPQEGLMLFYYDRDGRENYLHTGVNGELLDPWPSGFFDPSLRYILIPED